MMSYERLTKMNGGNGNWTGRVRIYYGVSVAFCLRERKVCMAKGLVIDWVGSFFPDSFLPFELCDRSSAQCVSFFWIPGCGMISLISGFFATGRFTIFLRGVEGYLFLPAGFVSRWFL